MTHELYTAFPTAGIPLFLERWLPEPHTGLVRLMRALEEAVRLMALGEVARAAQLPERAPELEARVGRLRLADTRELLALAEELRDTPVDFPSWTPPAGEWRAAVEGWLARRDAFVDDAELDSAWLGEAEALRSLVHSLLPGPEYGFFLLRDGTARRLHPFFSVTGGSPLAAAAPEALVAVHSPSGRALRLDPLYFEYGGALFGHFTALNRMSGLDPATGYLFFSSREFEPFPEPLALDGAALAGARGACFEEHLEFLGTRGEATLVADRRAGTLHWLLAAGDARAARAVERLSRVDSRYVVRFTELRSGARYAVRVFLSEPLLAPALEPLLLWVPDLHQLEAARIQLSIINALDATRDVNLGAERVPPAEVCLGLDGHWKWLPPLDAPAWSEEACVGAARAFLDQLPAGEVLDALRGSTATGLTALARELTEWSSLASEVPPEPPLPRLHAQLREASPSLPDRDAAHFRAALEANDRPELLRLLDAKVEFFNSSPLGSLFLGCKGRVLLEDGQESGVAAMEEALTRCNRNLSALMPLIRYHEALSDHARVYELLKTRLGLVESLDERAAALQALKRVCSQELDRPAEALECAEELASLRPETLESVRDRRRLATRVGDAAKAMALAERELDLLPVDALNERLELLRALAAHHGREGGDPASALAFGQRLLKELPGDLDTLRLMLGYIQPGDASEVALAVLEGLDKLRDFMEERERREVLTRLGEVLQKRHAPRERTAGVLEDVLSRDPGNLRARQALILLELEAGHVAEAAEHLKRIADRDPPVPQQAEALQRLVGLYRDRLGDRAAAAQYLSRLYEIAPDSPGVFEELVREARAVADLGRLRDVYRRRLASPVPENQAIPLYTAWLAAEEELDGPPEWRLALVEEALGRFPGRQVLWLELERLARALGKPERFVDALEKDLERNLASFGWEFVLKAAILADEALQDPERASALLAELLDREIIPRAGLIRLLRLLARAHEIERARQVLDYMLRTVASDEERRSLYAVIAMDLESEPETAPLAVDYFEKILAEAPQTEYAYTHLRAIHEGMEDWGALLALLERQVAHFPERQAETRLEIAELMEKHLGKVKEALEIVMEEVRQGRAGEGGLQKLMDREMSEDEWRAIVATLEQAFNASKSWDERRRYLESLAYINEEVLKDPAAASDALLRWYNLEPHNEELLNRVIDLLLKADRWSDVLHYYRNFLTFTDDPEERVRVLEKMADIYRMSFDNPMAALFLLNQALELANGPDKVRLLQSVRTLCLEHGFWEQALDNLDDQIQARVIPQVELLYAEKAKLLLDQLGDPARAEEAWQQALAADPGYKPAIKGLIALHMSRGAWGRVLELLELLESLSVDSVEERVCLRLEAAALARDKANEPERAARLYTAAIELMPERAEAYLPLLELCVQLRYWTDAEALAERVMEHILTIPAKGDKVRALQLLGRVMEELKRDEVAGMYYEKALAIDPDATEVELGLGFVYERSGQAGDALQIFRKLIEKDIERLPRASVALVRRKVTDLSLALEKPANRVELLEKQADESGQDPEVLRKLLAAVKEEEQWEKAIATAKTLVERTPFDDERGNLELEVADLYWTRLQMEEPAVEQYRRILQAHPDHAPAYIKLLEILIEREHFGEAIALLQQFVDHDRDDLRRANVLYSLGIMVRDHTLDVARAVECFNRSLDLDPNRLEAFSAIEEIVAKQGDVAAQVDNYQRMIQRIQGQGKTGLEYKLFLNLGKIYLTSLNDGEKAVTAFEKASSLRPSEMEPLEYLVEMAQSDDLQGILHERLLANLPTRKESLRFLIPFYTRKRDYDRVWNLIGSARMLGLVDDKEEQFYRAYLQKSVRIKKVVLEPEVAEKLLYRPETPSLADNGTLLGLLDRILGDRLQTRDPGRLGYPLAGALRADAHKNVAALAGLLKEILGLDRIAFAVSDADFACRKERLDQPTLVIGKRLLEEASIKKVAFLLAKYMCSFRPENLVWRIYPVKDLRTLLLGGLKAFNPGLKVEPEEEPVVASVANAIRASTEEASREELRRGVARFMDQAESVDIPGWMRTTELNLNRFGLLVANDVDMALAALKADGMFAPGLTAEETVKDLLAYQVSAPYARLKDVMGTAIKVAQQG